MEDYKAWVPSEYLAQYYATGDIAEDERGILRFIVEFFRDKKLHFSDILEVGCGPTIHHAIPFLPHVDRLYMSDYLDGNLNEIRKVIDQTADAHNWNQYLTGILNLEGLQSPSAIGSRALSFRSKVAGLLHCNVLDANPLGNAQKKFPLVTSFYCLECVTCAKEQWSQAMKNVLSLVAPGGWSMLSALRNASSYLVCGKEFPATSIDTDDMRTALIANGFMPETITMEVCPCEWAAEGFDSIIVCSAQKEDQA